FEVTANEIPDDVFRAHIGELWSLYLSGFIREAYKFSDDKGALYIIEADSLNEAKANTAHLSLSINAYCTYDFIALGPYRSWEKFFQSNDEEIKQQLNIPVEKITNESELQYIWSLFTFNSNFTHEKYRNNVVKQAIQTFRYYKAGIFKELYVMQRPLIVTINVVAKDVQEADIYFQGLPFVNSGMLDWESIPLSPFDYWAKLQ
ncbi:6046_t:CDS:2, partial [Ambispora gerdemannii]